MGEDQADDFNFEDLDAGNEDEGEEEGSEEGEDEMGDYADPLDKKEEEGGEDQDQDQSDVDDKPPGYENPDHMDLEEPVQDREFPEERLKDKRPRPQAANQKNFGTEQGVQNDTIEAEDGKEGEMEGAEQQKMENEGMQRQ